MTATSTRLCRCNCGEEVARANPRALYVNRTHKNRQNQRDHAARKTIAKTGAR